MSNWSLQAVGQRRNASISPSRRQEQDRQKNRPSCFVNPPKSNPSRRGSREGVLAEGWGCARETVEQERPKREAVEEGEGNVIEGEGGNASDG